MPKGMRRTLEQQIADLEAKKQALLNKKQEQELEDKPLDLDNKYVAGAVKHINDAVATTHMPLRIVLLGLVRHLLGDSDVVFMKKRNPTTMPKPAAKKK